MIAKALVLAPVNFESADGQMNHGSMTAIRGHFGADAVLMGDIAGLV